MDKKELAQKLNNSVYRHNFNKKLVKEAKANGLVICFGYSDDLFELDGAIEDEGDCYEGGSFLVGVKGIVRRPDSEEDDDVKYNRAIDDYVAQRDSAKKIDAFWCKEGNLEGWSFKTGIPHETFNVIDTEGERSVQCIGIVFSIEDLK